jgi:alkanesulfonate monooxygenase SsuD/methylene tetrahydromethanopterin reductase-like flavin-dependent oxidoreductase (luciferase family)
MSAMRRVVEFGDGWHIALLTTEQIRSLYERLRGAMDKAGRDFSKLEFTAMTRYGETLTRHDREISKV